MFVNRNYFGEGKMEIVLYATLVFVGVCLALGGLILLCCSIFSPKGTCEVKINNDPTLTKRVKAGKPLLQALLEEGIAIPSPCGGKGSCKQCRVRIVEGAEPPYEVDVSSFSKKMLDQGWRLSCQTKVKNDLSIEIDEKLLSVKSWEATVVSNNNIASFIKELVVMLPQGETVQYRPGGYLQVLAKPFVTNTDEWKAHIDPKYWGEWEKYSLFSQKLDFSAHKEEVRAYSLASYPEEKEKLMFHVRIATPPFVEGKISQTIPWGFGSSYLFSRKPGDIITVSGPYGHSFMKEGDQDVVFLIGGAGSSFCRSHVLDLFRTAKTKRHISLWYGARSLKENIYRDEYENLEKEFPNFKYNLVLSEPTKEDIALGWPEKDPIKTNFLFRAFEEGELKKLKAPEEAYFYVCGPPLHNKSVMKLLDDYGVPRENIVLDDFGS